MNTTATVTTATSEPAEPVTPAWRETRREPAVRLRDNPIARAFARRALRPTRVWPDALVIAIIGSLMTWGASDASMNDRDVLYRLALAFFALPLVLVAPASIASNIGLDRANGLLDFHRSSPTSALSNVYGYMAGNAARWIFCSSIGLPFTVAISLFAHRPISSTATDIALVLAYGVFYASIGAAAGVLVNASRVAQAGVGAGVPILLHFASAVGVTGGHSAHGFEPLFLGTLSPLVAVIPRVSDGARYVAALNLCVWSFFALRIAVRRFSRETAIPFTRVDAFAFVVATTALHALHSYVVPSTIFSDAGSDAWMASLVAALLVCATTIGIATFWLMPRRSHIVAWARRTAGDPLAPAASAIANQGASIVPVTLVLGLVAIGLALTLEGSLEGLRVTLRPMIHVAGAAALLPVLFVSAAENSTLRHPRNVAGWTVLSFVLLMIPLGGAALVSIADVAARDQLAPVIASFSPLSLPFAGFDGKGVPLAAWGSTFAAIVFFVVRARSARRALVARVGTVRA